MSPVFKSPSWGSAWKRCWVSVSGHCASFVDPEGERPGVPGRVVLGAKFMPCLDGPSALGPHPLCSRRAQLPSHPGQQCGWNRMEDFIWRRHFLRDVGLGVYRHVWFCIHNFLFVLDVVIQNIVWSSERGICCSFYEVWRTCEFSKRLIISALSFAERYPHTKPTFLGESCIRIRP